jgi:predicted adenine nucleotide alpha hydrolase (AANH) superfamily ATPase
LESSELINFNPDVIDEVKESRNAAVTTQEVCGCVFSKKCRSNGGILV